MKKIFTLIAISFFVVGTMSSQIELRNLSNQKYKADPSYKYVKSDWIKSRLSARTGDTACETQALNMPLFYLMWAEYNGYNLKGNWYQSTPEVYATQITTNVNPKNSSNKYSITMVYDTMITNVFSKSSFYKVDKSKSYIKLDSLTIFGAIQVPDTSNLSILANDTFVISTYLSNNGVLGAKVFDSFYTLGNGGLKKFVFQGQYLGARKIKYSHKFNKGESFSIRLEYRTKRLDTGFVISYCLADSCGQVTFNNQTFTSPAAFNAIYPGLVRTEDIDSTSPSTATIRNSNNSFAYNLTGVPNNCRFIYEQMYYVIPQVIICKELQGSIVLGADFPCYKDQATAYALISGGKPPYTYSWTSTGGVTLHANNLDSAIFTMNKSGNFNLNVTVTDAGSNTITLSKNVANFTPSFTSFTLTPSKTNLSSCQDSIKIDVPNYSNTTYSWTGAGTSSTNSIFAKKAGVYSVRMTFNPSGCNYDSSITITSSFTPPTLDFSYSPIASSGKVCQDKEITFTVASSAVRPNWTYSWKDGSTALPNSPGTDVKHTFSTTGNKTITLSADSSGCSATPVSKQLTVVAKNVSPCGTVSIKESISDAVSIYPNPVSSGQVSVQNDLNQTLTVRVTNMLGRVLISDKASALKTSTFDINGLPNGVYFIELENKSDRIVKKILVDK